MKTDLPATATFPTSRPGKKPGYPGIPITCNRNQLVAEHVEVRITGGGIFYPVTPIDRNTVLLVSGT